MKFCEILKFKQIFEIQKFPYIFGYAWKSASSARNYCLKIPKS